MRLPRLRAIFTAVVLAGLIVGAVSYLAAPWEAFRALRSAALAGDEAGMTGLMDLDAVRASLRGQMAGQTPAPAPDLLDNLAGALAGVLNGTAPAGPPNVDGLLTPQALTYFTHAHAKEAGAPFRVGDLLPGLHGSEIRFWGPNIARIAVLTAASDKQEAIFTFERRGAFKWRLTQIRLPGPVTR